MAAKEPSQALRPHALVVPWSAQGHINPMMHLSKKLAGRGVIITFANTQSNHDRLIQSQSESHDPSPLSLDIRLVGIPVTLRSPAPHLPSDIRYQIEATAQSLMDMEDSLVQLAQTLQPPVTCIIAGVFVPSGLNVARKLGIPHVGFWTQSAASYAAHVIFAAEGFPPPSKEISPRGGEVQNLITCIPGCPPLRFNEVPTFLQPCDTSDFLFWFSTLCFQQLHESAFVLLNTYDGLEEGSLKFIRKENVCTIGPALPSEFFSSQNVTTKIGTSLWPEDYGCVEWLDKQEPSTVLYVSFGSVAVLSAQQIEEFAMGLEASQSPILMVVRPTLMYGESAVFPQGFADRMKNRAIFVEWAPQLHVLSHVAVGGFLTHCGWNSTLESVSRGVPMLCWPYFSDQMMDCRCIVDGWKVGLDFDADENGLVSRVDVEKKVRTLMDPKKSKEMRERAAKLKDAARTAMMEGGSSHTNLELFISFLTNP